MIFPSLGDLNYENAPIALRQMQPFDNGSFNDYAVRGVETSPFTYAWFLEAYAVCANVQ